MGRTIFEVKIKEPKNQPGFQPSFFKRIMGKKSAPKIYKNHEKVEIYEYKGDVLRPILNEILKHMEDNIGTDDAIQMILSYIAIDPVDYCLYRRKDEWFASFAFSSCAGMADTSQIVICHWMEQYEKLFPNLYKNIFKKHGFEMLGYDKIYDKEIIIPFSELGYAIYEMPEGDACYKQIAPDDLWEVIPLMFDAAILESYDEIDNTILSFLKRTDLKELSSKCRCKLCSPEFNLLTL